MSEQAYEQVMASEGMQEWLARTADLRKRLCAAEKRSAARAARKRGQDAARAEAFWAKHPHLRPKA